jgi:hypothetical protein
LDEVVSSTAAPRPGGVIVFVMIRINCRVT